MGKKLTASAHSGKKRHLWLSARVSNHLNSSPSQPNYPLSLPFGLHVIQWYVRLQGWEKPLRLFRAGRLWWHPLPFQGLWDHLISLQLKMGRDAGHGQRCSVSVRIHSSGIRGFWILWDAWHIFFFLVPNSLCKLHTDVHVKTKIKVKMEWFMPK